MMDATPSPVAELGARLATIALDPGLPPDAILDELYGLPATAGELVQQEPMTYADSATVVFIDDPQAAIPSFGSIVVLLVEPTDDAVARVDLLRHDRWGPDELHTITDRSAGNESEPAWVDFWRVFPPGQFAIPNQPVYFRIWYRAGDGYAFMVIGSNPANRELLTDAVIDTLGTG